MGYTHYLDHYMNRDGKLSERDCLAASEACAELLSRIPGKKLAKMLEPVVNDDSFLAEANELALAGHAKELPKFCATKGHGFFLLPKACESVNFMPGKNFFFCKTGTPGTAADSLVVALFLAVQHATGGRMRFSTDGMPLDLRNGLELYRDCMGRPADISFAYAGERTESPDVGNQLEALHGDGLTEAVASGVRASLSRDGEMALLCEDYTKNASPLAVKRDVAARLVEFDEKFGGRRLPDTAEGILLRTDAYPLFRIRNSAKDGRFGAEDVKADAEGTAKLLYRPGDGFKYSVADAACPKGDTPDYFKFDADRLRNALTALLAIQMEREETENPCPGM